MPTYATANEIRDMLGIDITVMSDETINRYIDMAESYIDRLSDTCWNGKVCTSDLEYHTLQKYQGGYWYGLGIPVPLKHRPIKQILKLELFEGSSWRDLVATGTEARNTGDYWVDYEEGWIYINLFWFWQGGKELRVQYTYGRDDLPDYVKELTVVLAMKYILTFDRRRAVLYEGDQTLSVREIIEQLNNRQAELEDMVRAVKIVSGTIP